MNWHYGRPFMKTFNVVIADDHPIVLQGCRRVLEDAGIEQDHIT